MFRRKSTAVEYCRNRAAECAKVANASPRPRRPEHRSEARLAWLKLAQNAEFTERLDGILSGEPAADPKSD
jgi:hypothetical protein